MLCRLNALSSLGDEFYPTSIKPEDICTFRRCVEEYRNIGHGLELSVHVEAGVAEEEEKEEVEEEFCALTQ